MIDITIDYPESLPLLCETCDGAGGGYQFGSHDGQGQPVPDVCPDCDGSGVDEARAAVNPTRTYTPDGAA